MSRNSILFICFVVMGVSKDVPFDADPPGVLATLEPIAEGGIRRSVPCAEGEYDSVDDKKGDLGSCRPRRCGRKVVDGFVGDEEIKLLRDIAAAGMQSSDDVEAGPVIMDPNSKVVMDSKHGLRRVKARFDASQIAVYRGLMRRIEDAIKAEFGAERAHHTVPTFLTRIRGNPSWEPKNMHDEYYHPHVDKANTPHYVYSGLLYLSDFSRDFEGGQFRFLDPDGNRTVLPKRGRLSLFTSGRENEHMLERVTGGERLTLSFWFTCDPELATDKYLGQRAAKKQQFKEVDFSAAGQGQEEDGSGTAGAPGRPRRRRRRGSAPQGGPDADAQAPQGVPGSRERQEEL